jgi:hypothetical protein
VLPVTDETWVLRFPRRTHVFLDSLRSMTRLAACLLCLALAGCGAAPAGKSQAVDPGTEFTLAPGAMAAVNSAGFKLRFVAVSEDSRCPRDTTCIWAGEVKAQIDIVRISETLQVEIAAGDSAVAGDFRVTLVRVEPQPVSTAKIAAQDYRATLKLDAAN